MRNHGLALFSLLLLTLIGCQNLVSMPSASQGLLTGAAIASMGQVVGLDGKPAAGVQVRGYLVSNNSGSLVSNNSGSLVSNNSGSLQGTPAGYRILAQDLATQTDAQGRFALAAPEGAVLNVEAILSEDVKAIELNVTSSTHDLKLPLAYTGSITGRVTAPAQAAVSNFQGVDVYVPGTSYLAKTDASGGYTLSNVAVGTFNLVASKTGLGTASASGVRVESKVSTAAPDLALSQRVPAIASLVPDNGGPGAVVTVTGDNFGASTGELLQVSFANAVATQVERKDDRTLRVTVPDGAGTGNLVVSVGGVTSAGMPFSVIASLELHPGNQFLVPGATLSFVPTAQDEKGRAIAHPVVTWTSTGSSFDLNDALFTAREVGDAQVRVDSGKVSSRRSVHILASYPRLTTLAGPEGASASVAMDPLDVMLDGQGGLWITDSSGYQLLRLALATKTLTVLAGNGACEHRDGPAVLAGFQTLGRMARDPVSGDRYVTEYFANDIRRIASDGTVSTLCGSDSGRQDGPLASATFAAPNALAISADGVMYVAEGGNHCIRKIDHGTVSTLAGDGVLGEADGTGAMARFNSPEGLAIDDQGDLIVTDSGNHNLRKVTPDGVVTTLAGSPTGEAGNFDGTGTEARFNTPYGVAVDGLGRIFVADMGNNRIRRVERDGTVYTVAGCGTKGHLDGPAPDAQLFYPSGLAIDADGTLYLADNGSDLIRSLR